MKSFGVQPKWISFRSPWENGVAERWVGSCRHDLLDHVIVLNERHLKRLMNEYLHYYQDDRTHLALDKRTPAGRLLANNLAVDMAGFYLRPNSAACITVIMVWPLELLFEHLFVRVKDD